MCFLRGEIIMSRRHKNKIPHTCRQTIIIFWTSNKRTCVFVGDYYTRLLPNDRKQFSFLMFLFSLDDVFDRFVFPGNDLLRCFLRHISYNASILFTRFERIRAALVLTVHDENSDFRANTFNYLLAYIVRTPDGPTTRPLRMHACTLFRLYNRPCYSLVDGNIITDQNYPANPNLPRYPSQ